MSGPDMRAYMQGLIGRELFTPVDRHSNWIVRLTNGSVIVRTAGNQEGGAVSIDFVQGVVNRIYDGEEVVSLRVARRCAAPLAAQPCLVKVLVGHDSLLPRPQGSCR